MISEFWKQHEKNIIIHKDKMNLVESIDRHAIKNPDKLALFFEDESIKKFTYKEFQQHYNQFANLLSSLDLKPNSKVFIFLPKCPEFYFCFLGAIKSGNIAIPLFEAFQQDGLELRLNRGDADVLVTNKELSQRISKDIHKKIPSLKHILIIDEDKYHQEIKSQSKEFNAILKNKLDTALMLFTSSTAGTPVAGIEISHYALVQQYFTAELVLKLNRNSNYFCTAHPGWVTGSVYGILAPFAIGCSVFSLEGRFDSKKWINFIIKNKIDILYTAPTVLRLFKPDIKSLDLKNIKVLASVGEALTESVFSYYKKLGIEITDTYWQTETGAMVIASWEDKIPGSLGKPIPGITAKLINETIALKPDFPSLMTGIYKHEKMFKSYFKNGWFTTKDMAQIKKQHFFFKQREDDIIKTSGERVSPIEVESVLMNHKAVKEAAVIGIPDEIKGQIIKAFIVLNKNFNASEELKQELSLFVKQNYAGHSYPKIIEFIKQLPKTNSGKIIRMKLRELS